MHAIWRVKNYPAVANIGTRPTVGRARNPIRSAFIGFYGRSLRQRLTVEFIEKIRDEKRFESIEQLREQIQQDIAQGRAHFQAVLTEGNIQ